MPFFFGASDPAPQRNPLLALVAGVTGMRNRRFMFGLRSRWAGVPSRTLQAQSIDAAINLMVFSGIVLVFRLGALLALWPANHRRRSGTGLQPSDIQACCLQRMIINAVKDGSERP